MSEPTLVAKVTCAICEGSIDLIPDGVVRYCQCKLLGVDCTKEYTRYLGTIPKEDVKYEGWYGLKREQIDALRHDFGLCGKYDM